MNMHIQDSFAQALLCNATKDVYNIDKAGILLSVLGSFELLVASDNLRSHRVSGVQRTLFTAMKYISTDGGYLPPLVI